MSAHLDELRHQYPGQLVLTAEEVAKVLGRERQTVYNQVSTKKFPVRIIKQQGKKGGWGCSIIDLANYLDTGIPYTVPVEPDKPKRGRKPKPLLVLHQEFWSKVVFEMRKNDAKAEDEELNQLLEGREFPPNTTPHLSDS